MAVFLINICKFNGCGITFPSLGDLIQHIEDTHIDYDPKVVEQKEQTQPACLPLSYVLRFISEDARKENQFLSANTTAGVELKRKLAIKHHSYSMSSSNRSNTPTGSEMDDDEMAGSDSEDSNDSWTTEEFSSEFIMRYGSRHSGNGNVGTPGNEKPFACPVPGCKKRYKNVNGIKYHSKNGHKKDGKVRKGYKCHCGKSYKTAQGLKNHALLTHNSTTTENHLTTTQHLANNGNVGGNVNNNNSNNNNSAGIGIGSITSNNVNGINSGILTQRSSSPSQSLGSLSPSSISNMSSSASSCQGGNIGGNNILNPIPMNPNAAQQQQQLTNVLNVNNLTTATATTTTTTILQTTTNNCNSANVQQQQMPQLQHFNTTTTTANNNNINNSISQQQQQIRSSPPTSETSTNRCCLAAAAAAAKHKYETLLNDCGNTGGSISFTSSSSPSSLSTLTAVTAATSLTLPQHMTTPSQTAIKIATAAITPIPANLPTMSGGATNSSIPPHLPITIAAIGGSMTTNTSPTADAASLQSVTTSFSGFNARTVSPTFIEHKYSAHSLKEKFWANMKSNQIQIDNKKVNAKKCISLIPHGNVTPLSVAALSAASTTTTTSSAMHRKRIEVNGSGSGKGKRTVI